MHYIKDTQLVHLHSWVAASKISSLQPHGLAFPSPPPLDIALEIEVGNCPHNMLTKFVRCSSCSTLLFLQLFFCGWAAKSSMTCPLIGPFWDSPAPGYWLTAEPNHIRKHWAEGLVVKQSPCDVDLWLVFHGCFARSFSQSSVDIRNMHTCMAILGSWKTLHKHLIRCVGKRGSGDSTVYILFLFCLFWSCYLWQDSCQDGIISHDLFSPLNIQISGSLKLYITALHIPDT